VAGDSGHGHDRQWGIVLPFDVGICHLLTIFHSTASTPMWACYVVATSSCSLVKCCYVVCQHATWYASISSTSCTQIVWALGHSQLECVSLVHVLSLVLFSWVAHTLITTNLPGLHVRLSGNLLLKSTPHHTPTLAQ